MVHDTEIVMVLSSVLH